VLNGHCNSPIAGYSSIVGAQMSLPASVLDEAGLMFIEASRSGPADRPRELGRAVGLELLDRSHDRSVHHTSIMDCTEDGENLASHWLT
jgi:porphobilinogen deaminase